MKLVTLQCAAVARLFAGWLAARFSTPANWSAPCGAASPRLQNPSLKGGSGNRVRFIVPGYRKEGLIELSVALPLFY